MKSITSLCLIAGYGVGFFLTYGYVYQHVDVSGADGASRFAMSSLAAICWPVYWAGRLSLIITQGWTF